MNAICELPTDHRRHAKHLYWQGYRVCEIAELIGEKEKTVHSWKTCDEWDRATPLERIQAATEARLVQLILKDPKSGSDYKEIDLLHRQLERQARIKRFQDGGTETDLNPELAKRNAGEKRKPKRNDIPEELVEKLVETFLDGCFDYQKDWYRAGGQRTRAILKSRQIGATFYFAREALIDALTTGRNQIFLSASKAQAHIFKAYIQAFARDTVGVELTGDPIILPNGAELHFLGTNARTAQGYHGNFYFDEFFWTFKFNELNKVASGMAMQKQYRRTYFSTPSSMAHEAYSFWTGERFNKGKPSAQHLKMDISHGALQQGQLCDDRIWRQIVTILDAEDRGCDLFDIDELRLEYDAAAFQNLLMCQFVDDGASIFPLNMLQSCMVDSWSIWEDYKPFAARPFAGRQVPRARAPPVPRHGLHRAGRDDSPGNTAVLGHLHRDRHHRPGQRRGPAGAPVLPGAAHILLQPRGQGAPGDEGLGRDQQGPAGVRRRLDRPGAVADGHPQDRHSRWTAVHLRRWTNRQHRPCRPGMGTLSRIAQRAARGPDRGQHRHHGVQLSEVAAKDDFAAIKNISRDDLLAALRTPPQLMGVVPQNAGGFGSIREATQIWAINELEPIQARLAQVNDWLGEEVVSFRPFEIPAQE